MMEFNDVLNRVLKGDPEGRRRGLRLRTYCVTCLNEVGNSPLHWHIMYYVYVYHILCICMYILSS